jgi:hypothetical protein
MGLLIEKTYNKCGYNHYDLTPTTFKNNKKKTKD